MKTNVLFVCNFNMMRSATAEMLFKDDPMLKVKSAGISPEAVMVIDQQLVDWAEIIFVMEPVQQQFIEKNFPRGLDGKRIICLSIDDRYAYMDERLQRVLRSTVERYLQKIFSEEPPSVPDGRCP